MKIAFFFVCQSNMKNVNGGRKMRIKKLLATAALAAMTKALIHLAAIKERLLLQDLLL